MIDMHAHLYGLEKRQDPDELEKLVDRELTVRRESGITTCFSSGTPQECELLCRFGKRSGLRRSFGIHPWYADRHRPEECDAQYENCDMVGEIGMDSVWCQVPREIQRRSLERQLQIAADLKKPVILHTKGEERLIGQIIRDFPGKVCVHWYSGTREDLEPFLEKDCYFTLGPDMPQALKDPGSEAYEIYRGMLTQIPEERLFVETDGISAVAWARGAKWLPLEEIPSVLQESLKCAAKWKHMQAAELELRMEINLKEFLCGSGIY